MKAIQLAINTLWNKKISALHASFAFLALLMVMALQYYFHSKPTGKTPQPVASEDQSCPPPSIVKYNMTEYKFAHPLLVVDVLNQGEMANNPLSGLENGINLIIDEGKRSAGLMAASIYIQQLNTGNFINMNGDERFHPASMMKVPVAMIILREAEVKPGLLDKEFVFNNAHPERTQYYPGSTAMVQGKKYTIRQLIQRSLIQSDNDADLMLTSMMNKERWNRLFASLELPFPDMSNMAYSITPSEYSRFMRILYNATYLSNEDADYMLSMLSQTEFKQGIAKHLPADVLVSHKFGEYGENDANGTPTDREMHESGIIYISGNPVLITIMTRGKDGTKLPKVISDISRYVYDQMKGKGS